MSDIFERLGVATIVNAKGTSTRLSGAILSPEVAEAMRQASTSCVEMTQLQARASEIIAEATGAEAGYVTSGAAAGLLLGTAAAVTGLDPARMNRLPDTTGMANQVVVARSHRNFYDHAVRTVGVELVEVGLADRFAGAGVRDTEAWEIAEAIDERTAAVLYVAQPHARPSLAEVVAAAHGKGVPVIVDAAGQLPPAANLTRFLAEGADLVAFSGGKALGGPQCSGILAGRRDLIQAAALQNLDTDIFFEQWNPPPGFLDKSRLPGLPQHGIGRPCKVGREEVVGLLTALGQFIEEGDEARARVWTATAEALRDALAGTPSAEITLVADSYRPGMAGVVLKLDEAAAGMSAMDLLCRLQDGEPGVHVDNARVHDGVIGFAPVCLRPGDIEIIARRVGEELGRNWRP